MLSQPVPTLSQPQWHLHGSKDLKERYDSSPTNRPHWHKHKKEELRWPPGLPEACDLAFHNQDRLLQRGALDAAQCHRAFGQVLLRLFPQGAPAGRPAALLDRAFSESDQDLDGLLLLQEFHFFVLRGLQPILTGAAQQSPAAQAAALQSAQLAAQAFATQTKMPTPELTKTPPPEEYEIPEVYESLGSGAFGTVLKVRHTGTGELRACKAVQLQNGSEALKELVELEVTMLKSLDHLNLLRLFEAFRDGDRCVYLVTELCAGGSLAERLEQQRRTRRPMLEGQSAAYAEQMLSAASYCHQRGVLHRDLKPENVLFLTRAPDSPLKVIDFGLSDTLERLWQNATEELQDRSGALGAVARMLPKLPGGLEILATKVTKEVMQRAGTPHYMAPEVYEGQYGEKADVWSIGVMIFEMLTNRHPFYTLGNDLETVRRRILAPRGADFVDASWRQVSPSALSACSIALEPNVIRRPSAKELLNNKWFLTVPRLALGVSGDSGSSASKVAPSQVLLALRHFAFPGYMGSTRIRLRQAFLRLLVQELAESQLKSLRGFFLRLDCDSDGVLSASDLGTGDGEDEMSVLLAVAGGQSLGFSDFVAVMLPFYVSVQEQQLRSAFKRLDLQSRDVLSRQVLQDMLQVGHDVAADELEDLLAGLPEELNFTDFKELLHLEK